MNPLQVIDAISDSTMRDIDVWSPDTDVLTLLVDLVTHGRLGAFTRLNSLTGKGDKYRSINIRERVHNLTGADWGGKFVGTSKKSWITSYLSLPNDDPIVSAFQLIGEGVLTSHEQVNDELPEEVRPIEKFI